MQNPNPSKLAEAQLARDHAATSRFPELFERKVARMSESPLAYLRGTAPLFYHLLAKYTDLGRGPRGRGWLCGDAHIENFGVYRTAADLSRRKIAASIEPVVFDVNDFDEAVIGPWYFDVLRLVTSFILGGREMGVRGPQSVVRAQMLLETYVDTAMREGHKSRMPPFVAKLVEKVTKRSRLDLLEGRTVPSKLSRKFVRGRRYTELPGVLKKAAVRAFERYAAEVDPTHAFPGDAFEIVDLAFRIAGNGSLGKLRVAVLTKGKGGRDGAWIFDMKEQGLPAASVLVGRPKVPPAERVLTGLRACVERTPRMTGTTRLDRLSMFVRRLAPQEDKLDLTRMPPEEFDSLACYLGAQLGRAHRRGAIKRPEKPWSRAEQSALVDQAIALAGLHEAAYLAMCKLVEGRA